MNNFNLISAYIATIIILVITIGIGAVLYLYFSGYISQLTSETEEATTIKSIIECSKARIDSYAYITTTTSKDFKYGDFNYRIPITITERSGNTLIDYQVLVVINTQNLISQGKMRNDCGDIRFTDSDGKTLLNYWIEPNTCNTENTRIWVKVPYIPASSTKTIYLYYGNPEATSLSNGTATFIAFDWKFDGPISAGTYHTCALLSNGSIMCWGSNWAGQLGLGYTSYSEQTPKQVIGIDNAIAISTGAFHTCALLSNGSIMCWGDNTAGQLGLGYTSDPIPYPQQVIGIDNAIVISSGAYHTCALLSNGSIMCWGYNGHGQLGLGYTIDYAPIPQQTLNYNLGGMYFKTNDIYTPHTPNDIYFVRVYVEIEPTVSLGSEETSPIIKLTMINLGIELGKRYLIKLIYEDGKVIVRNITLDKNLSSGESKEIYLTDLSKGRIRKIEIYSIDVCPNMLVGIRSVNIEV
ncbi:MAG: DUF2341 domain-containing protein [Candidatus Aenigmatarchaeota archaeon]